MNKISAIYDKRPWVHYQAALKVAQILNKHKYDAYLIGGAVRDVLMGRLPKDFDIVTNAKPAQILKLPELSQAMYKDTAQAFGVTRVKVPVNIRQLIQHSEVEVATYRRDIEAHLGRKATKIEFATLGDDVKRRDFTINAMALDLANDFLVDLVGGLDDIEQKIVRFIGEPKARIGEDPLRILRGLRLKVQLGFTYEEATKAAIAEAVTEGRVEEVATERLRDELTRMLVHSTRRLAIEELDGFGIIKHVLPELDAGKGVKQPKKFHVEGDVWTHSLMAIDNLPTNPSTRLAWATLLHDIGKPPTFQPKSKTKDRIRFSEHYSVGAQMAKELLGRLKFPKKQIADICWMIDKHMGIDDLPKMREGRAREFMAHPAFLDLVELHKADAKASWNLLPSGKVKVPEPEFKEINEMWQRHQHDQQVKKPSLKDDLGVDGKWLMERFDLKTGAKLGGVLAALNEAYLDGEIKNQQDAKTLAGKLLAEK